MTALTLKDLGWTAHFASQIDATATPPLRIVGVQRTTVTALGPDGSTTLSAPQGTGEIAVGDWVTASDGAVSQVLDRQTTLARRAAGEDARAQLIAANVTTLGIVTSCNADFNERRLERYVIMAIDTGCLPLIILTKADMVEDADAYLAKANRLSPLVTSIAINARDPADIRTLYPWCRAGDTLALAGSSGVGKTTIRNGLTGEEADTQAIREDDARGRHTTTSRALVRTKAGGWLIDTPGMRALRLMDASEGIEAVFSDIEVLTQTCRFSDCAHDTEPGCSVQAAIRDGSLDEDRLRRWRKLKSEDMRNTESVAQARARDKGFGKMVKGAVKRKRRDQGD